MGLRNLWEDSSIEIIDSLSLNSYWLTIAIHLWLGPFQIFLIYIGMVNVIGNHTIENSWHSIPTMCRRHSLATIILVPWLLLYFCSVFGDVFWVLGVGVCCKCPNQGWALHSHLFSAVWPVVDFCNSCCLLSAAALWWGVSTYLRHKNKYVEIQLEVALVQQNGSSRFCSRPPSLQPWLIVASMSSLLLSKS